MKRIRFWGTRGSLPVALTAAGGAPARSSRRCAARRAARSRRTPTSSATSTASASPVAGTYGGHTSCVEIETGGPDYVLCDLGSGVRPFGQAALARHGPASPQTYPHLHVPRALGPHHGAAVLHAGLHPRQPDPHLRQPRGLESALRRQQDAPSFPVDFSFLRADIEFVHLEPGQRYDDRRHDGHARCCSGTPAIPTAIASRRTAGRVVYTTDSEHKLADPAETERFVEFFRDADLVIFDAMYSLADAISVKADWGHSSNIVGVELCQLAGVRAPVPVPPRAGVRRRRRSTRVLADTRRLEEITRTGAPLRVTAAYDGMEIEL